MTVAHTAGPWRVWMQSLYDVTVIVKDRLIARTDDGGDLEENLANARLISAAPELLAAAKEVIADVHASEHGAPTTSTLTALGNAIAKAEGES